jgi:hypothetical protein
MKKLPSGFLSGFAAAVAVAAIAFLFFFHPASNPAGALPAQNAAAAAAASMPAFAGNAHTYSPNESIRYATGKIGKSAAAFRPDEPTIILRLDDIQAKAGANTSMEMINDALNRDLPIVLGVIPYQLETDSKIVSFLSGLRNNSHVEIALHGFRHSKNEFANLSQAQAYDILQSGKAALSKQLGIDPVTFIPPNNVYSNGTLAALEASGFERMSASQDQLDYDGKLLTAGFNIRPPSDLTPEEQVEYNMDFAVNRCKAKLEEGNLCIVMLHPQDYATHWVTNASLMAQYGILLDRLSGLGAKFSTFAQLQSA